MTKKDFNSRLFINGMDERMKILITGANGFLGHYLTGTLLDQGHTVIATGKGDCRLQFPGHQGFTYRVMDFTNPFEVHDVFQEFKPEVVVHAGAMSKPDECEEDQWKAYTVNVEGTVTLLINAEEFKSFFIFVSTDFVFSGKEGMYRENDTRDPVNFYGKTKVEAEDAVMSYDYEWAIVRTVMVYGNPLSGRTNLLKVVEDHLEKGMTYKVFHDQLRTPTYVADLAEGIARIISKRLQGIFHISGEEVMSLFEMAIAVAEHLNLNKNLLVKIKEGDLSQPARRPLKTGFVIDKARNELSFQPGSFHNCLSVMYAQRKIKH